MNVVRFGGWDFFFQRGRGRVGVVLIHEVFGLNDYIKSVAVELAQNGVWTAAIDLFGGKTAATLEEGFKLRDAVGRDDLLNGLESGRRLLESEIGGGAVIGCMGFCMGGGFALLAACNIDFSFCIDYYGKIDDVSEVKGVGGPIQLILGSEDKMVTPWAYQSFMPAAVEFKKRVDVHLYPNAYHAFHRPGWEGHNPEAAKDAWEKTLLFLGKFK